MIDERSLQWHARFAGAMYLVSMAMFIGYFVIVGRLQAEGFAQTAETIASSETLYRIALALLLAGSVTILLIGWAFYVILKPVEANLALLAFVMRIVESVLVGFGATIRLTQLDNYLAAPGDAAAPELGRMIGSAYGASYLAGCVFLAVGTIIFFGLLFRSRFVPRPIAAFGVVAASLFLIMAFAHVVVPEIAASMGLLENLPMFLTEVGTGLWLAIRGVDFSHWRKARAGMRESAMPAS